MQTASGTILTASITSSERDQRPWVAAQLAAGAVTNAGRMSVTCKNGNIIMNLLLAYYIGAFYQFPPNWLREEKYQVLI